MRPTELIVKAVHLATTAHLGQTRDGLDEPYILHPMRVAMDAERHGLSVEAVAAAYLHDVAEDTARSLDDLRLDGIPPRVLTLVTLLTKWWNLKESERVLTPEAFQALTARVRIEFKPAYYARIMGDREALALKLLDRADNMEDMVRCLPAHRTWAKQYLWKTRTEFEGLALACAYPEVAVRYYTALWTLDKALTVASMAEAIRPLAEPAP